MEYLDIVNEYGEPTGETVERSIAHAKGIPHRTSHVWILRKKEGLLQVLLQKRCETKDSHPGCYDISSAGHIPAGCGFKESAIRELREELGIEAKEEELIECGMRHIDTDSVFFGKPYHDRQYSKVFVLWRDLDENQFTIQKEELEEVRWMGFEEAYKAVQENSIKHCIFPEELDLVRKGSEEETKE